MINIIAAPGCYGTYVARCLHHYTTKDSDYQFNFDQAGSSHAFRAVSADIKTAKLMHWSGEDYSHINKEITIIITADHNHQLDYFDNQYYKQSLGDLAEYLTQTLGIDKIQEQLKNGWGYTESFDHNTPRWIIREYLSFCLVSAWQAGYDNTKYLSVPHVHDFCCEDLWNTSIWDLVNTLARVLNKQVYAPPHIVNQNHYNFLQCQQYHNMQHRCNQFVEDTLKSGDTVSPCVSIFDEAYVQHLLRGRGYEISCDGLDTFPNSGAALLKITYETSKNHTQ